MYYIINLLHHLKHVRACMADMKGEAVVSVEDLALHVRIGQAVQHLLPQFSFIRDGRRHYAPKFEPHVGGFIGWKPYATKRWPVSTDKLLFRSWADDAKVRTPRHWQHADADLADFVIKRAKSSFGDGVRGPFRRFEPDNAAHKLSDGEYFEAFIDGQIAKAWYWNGELTALELRPPPSVVCDGRHTIQEEATYRCLQAVDHQALKWLMDFRGHDLAEVRQDGENLALDYKYASPYYLPIFTNENVLGRVQGTPLGEQFEQAGRAMLQAIPDAIRPNTVFTLDAVVDERQNAWFLEMNSHPMVHPDTYPAMLRSCFTTT